jgi:hypothetical protein
MISRLLDRVTRRVYSIGVYAGGSPIGLRPATRASRPALSRADVTDAFALGVADPFMIQVDGLWHMFFELITWRGGRRRGEIAHATSPDGHRWTYDRIVLAEPFHLSYPYVFERGSEIYMVPESQQAGGVRLYRAERFPDRWALAKVLLEGPAFLDSSLVHQDGRWWMFTCTALRNDTLRLFHAPDVTGPWVEHPSSPIVRGDAGTSRPAGRVVSSAGGLFRFAQDCTTRYGEKVRAFHVTRLTPSEYEEAEVADGAVLKGGGSAWNRDGIHHVDPHRLEDGRWIACVDGWRTGLVTPGEALRRILRST